VQNDRVQQVIEQLTGGIQQSKCNIEMMQGAGIDKSASCDHGSYQCFGNDLGICNFGTWSIITAPEGTACVPFDYEFIPDADWNTVFALVAPQCFDDVPDLQ
jgi:hypothetical protein